MRIRQRGTRVRARKSAWPGVECLNHCGLIVRIQPRHVSSSLLCEKKMVASAALPRISVRVRVCEHIHTFDRFKKDVNCLEEARERNEGYIYIYIYRRIAPLHPMKKNLLRHFTECHSKFALSQRVYFMGVRVTTNEATSENGGIGGNGFEGSREEARI